MAHIFWFVMMFAGLLLSALAQADADKSDPKEFFVKIDGPLLTVKATEIPHRQILEGMAKELNFELIIDGSLQERHSLDLEGRPWEEALKKALFPANWAFVYESAVDEPRLTKVFVLAPQWDRGTTGDIPTVPGREDTPSQASAQPAEAHAAGAPEHERKGVNAALTELLKDEDEFVRWAAISNIATIGGEKAVDALKQALQDKEPWVRAQAVEALMEIRGERAIEGLQQALEDEHPYVQRVAQEGLALLH
jgi:hypothetical protein